MFDLILQNFSEIDSKKNKKKKDLFKRQEIILSPHDVVTYTET